MLHVAAIIAIKYLLDALRHVAFALDSAAVTSNPNTGAPSGRQGNDAFTPTGTTRRQESCPISNYDYFPARMRSRLTARLAVFQKDRLAKQLYPKGTPEHLR